MFECLSTKRKRNQSSIAAGPGKKLRESKSREEVFQEIKYGKRNNLLKFKQKLKKEIKYFFCGLSIDDDKKSLLRYRGRGQKGEGNN